MDNPINSILKGMGRGHLEIVPTSVKDIRMSICTNCVNFTPMLRQCKLCHCLVDGKTWLARSSCPDSKWLAL